MKTHYHLTEVRAAKKNFSYAIDDWNNFMRRQIPQREAQLLTLEIIKLQQDIEELIPRLEKLYEEATHIKLI